MVSVNLNQARKWCNDKLAYTMGDKPKFEGYEEDMKQDMIRLMQLVMKRRHE